MTTCRICGTAIEAKSTGRPPTYCSTGCRRMSEREIRRLDNTITTLETEARWLRNPARLQMQTDAAHAEFLAAEIAVARKRLRALLGDEDDNAKENP